jgi:hypothetical protein
MREPVNNYFINNYSKKWNNKFRGDFKAMQRYFNSCNLSNVRYEFKAYCLYVLYKRSYRRNEVVNQVNSIKRYNNHCLSSFLTIPHEQLDYMVTLHFAF